MSANYVARELGYCMTEGWGQGDAATNAAFRPLETFSERFGTLLDEVAGLGVAVIDLWTAHLNPAWATPEHVAAAKRELERTGLSVSSLAGASAARRRRLPRAATWRRTSAHRCWGARAASSIPTGTRCSPSCASTV